MTDALLVTITIVAFLLAAGLVRLCAAFIDDDVDEAHHRPESAHADTGAPEGSASTIRTGAG
jgi:hypothetical protein